MALFDNGLKGNIVAGLAIGIGAAVVAPAVAPLIGGVIKPLAKAAIKGGIILSEKGKQAFAELKEVSEDLVAEARAELAEQQKIQETT
jgi:hypothetical protein